MPICKRLFCFEYNVCITRPLRVYTSDTLRPSCPHSPRQPIANRAHREAGVYDIFIVYLLHIWATRARRNGGIALVNYNSINGFALRTNLRTPRSGADQLRSHLWVVFDYMSVKRKTTKIGQFDALKIPQKSTRAVKKLDKNLVWLLKFSPCKQAVGLGRC